MSLAIVREASKRVLEMRHFDVQLIGGMVLHEGQITWPPPKPRNPGPAYSVDTGARPDDEVKNTPTNAVGEKKKASIVNATSLFLLALLAGIIAIGNHMPDSFLSHFTVFVLACFVGWQVIWNVKPALHTPLMSVTNAISGIIIIGGILQVSQDELNATVVLGSVAILLASINIAGGFLVTNRMLAMFRRQS